MAIDQVNTWLGAAVSLALALAGLGAMSLAIGRIAGASLRPSCSLLGRRCPIGLASTAASPVASSSFGLPLAGASVIVFVVGYADQLVVGSQLGATALGFYVLAFNLASWPVSIFSQPLRSVAPAAFARLQDDPEKMDRAFRSVFGCCSQSRCLFACCWRRRRVPVVRVVYGNSGFRRRPCSPGSRSRPSSASSFELSYDYLVVRGATRNILVVQILWLVALPPALMVGAQSFGLVGVAAGQLLVSLLVVVPAYGVLLRRTGSESVGWCASLCLGVLAGAIVGVHVAASLLHQGAIRGLRGCRPLRLMRDWRSCCCCAATTSPLSVVRPAEAVAG